MRLNSKPVKVYKSTISCVMYVLLFSAGIAFCIWVAISNFNNDARLSLPNNSLPYPNVSNRQRAETGHR